MSVFRPLECLRCGHKWVARIMQVGRCPSCKSHLWNRPKKTLSPRIDGKSDFEQIKDAFQIVQVPFNSAELSSIETGPSTGKQKPHGELFKARHRIKVASVEFLFDDKGEFLGIDAGAQFIPRK